MTFRLGVVIAVAAFAVLVAVVASGLGPVTSLRRTLKRFAEDMGAETERLTRQAEILERRTRDPRDRT